MPQTIFFPLFCVKWIQTSWQWVFRLLIAARWLTGLIFFFYTPTAWVCLHFFAGPLHLSSYEVHCLFKNVMPQEARGPWVLDFLTLHHFLHSYLNISSVFHCDLWATVCLFYPLWNNCNTISWSITRIHIDTTSELKSLCKY